jgi:hypothetical protein
MSETQANRGLVDSGGITHYQIQRWACWCAPIFTLLVLIGWFGMAQGAAPVPADWSAADTQAWFVAHQTMTAIGCTIFLVATIFLCFWICQLSVMLVPLEGGAPVLSMSQAAGGISVVALVVLSCCLWIGAGYRAHASPDIAVLYNDASWFGFLLGWVMLAVQMLATGLAGLAARGSWLPRSWSWLTLAGLIPLAMANGPAFVTSGPFAFHGVLGYYVPMIVWGIWLNGTTYFMLRQL